jgi:hypothetical protein
MIRNAELRFSIWYQWRKSQISQTPRKWLNDTLHIFFNNREIKYEHIKGKPKKKGYKVIAPAKDHPWRKMNNKLPGGKGLATASG